MWKLCILLLASTAWAQAPGPNDKVFSLNVPGGQGNFKDCGFISRTSPNLTESLSPACFQSLNNLYLDSDGSLDRRGGFAKYNLTPCQDSKPIRGMWPFNATDGTKYLVMYSSASMFYSSGVGDCTMINVNGTNYWGLSQTAEMQCVQSAGYLWCGNGVDAPFRTDVKTSSQSISGAPVGPLIGTYRNRILIGGVSGTLTDIYLSGELNGLDWTLPAITYSTSPAIVSLNGTNDGVKTNCFMGEFQNQYLFGRDYDLWALSGYSIQDFALRKVSNQIGCTEPKSVQEVNNQLIWISKRGVEAFTGTQIQPISYYIRPTIAQIISASGNSRSQTLTTQADWNTGQLCGSGPKSCVSTTISPGNVVPSSWSITDNFKNGTLLNVSTNVPGFLYVFDSTGVVFNNAGAELNNYTNWNTSSLGACAPVWAPNNSAPAIGSKFGTYSWMLGASLSSSNNFSLTVLNASGVPLTSYSTTLSGQTPWTYVPISISTLPASQVILQISGGIQCNNGGSVGTGIITSSAIVSGNYIPLWLGQGFQSVAGVNTYEPVFDFDETIPQITSGTYTSCYDTGISTPVWGIFNGSIASSGTLSALNFQTKVSKVSCSSGFDVPVTATPGSIVTSANKEFIAYVSSFTILGTTNTPAGFSTGSPTLQATTTGYFITPAILVSSPTSWGLFNVDAVTNGGSFTFWISTGGTAAAATSLNAPWVLQSPNAQIVVSTSTTYIAARILFNVDVATEVPTLNDITFNWNNGSNRPPTSSLQYQDRYYLFYTTNTVGSPVNDHAAVFDFNNKWELLDDINAYSATLYLNQPYVGDANATGTVYQLESGQSDNGGAFNYSWTTGDMSFGAPAQRKNFKRLYLFVNQESNSSQNIALTCTYSLDGDGGNYPLNSYTFTDSPAGYSVVKFQFPTTQPTTGHWVNVSCSNTGTQGPIKTYGFQLIYSPSSWE